MGQLSNLKNAYQKTQASNPEYFTYEKLEAYKPDFVDATKYAIAVRDELRAIKNYKMDLLTVKEFSSKLSKEAEEKRNELQVEIEAMRFSRM